MWSSSSVPVSDTTFNFGGASSSSSTPSFVFGSTVARAPGWMVAPTASTTASTQDDMADVDEDDMTDEDALHWLVSPPDAVQDELDEPIDYGDGDADDDDDDDDDDHNDAAEGDMNEENAVAADDDDDDADDADAPEEFASALYDFLVDTEESGHLSLAEVVFLEEFAYDTWSAAGVDPLEKVSGLIDGSWTEEDRAEFATAVESRRGDSLEVDENYDDTDSESEEAINKDTDVMRLMVVDSLEGIHEIDGGLDYIMSNTASQMHERMKEILSKYDADNKFGVDRKETQEALVKSLDLDTLHALFEELEPLNEEGDEYTRKRARNPIRLEVTQFASRIVDWLKQIIPKTDERYAHIKTIKRIEPNLDEVAHIIEGNYDNDQGDYDDALQSALYELKREETQLKKALSAIYHHTNTTDEQREVLKQEWSDYINLAAIRMEQKGYPHAIDRETMRHLVEDKPEPNNSFLRTDITWTDEAIDVLRIAATDHLVSVLAHSQSLAAQHVEGSKQYDTDIVPDQMLYVNQILTGQVPPKNK